jgi:hypothetical protein
MISTIKGIPLCKLNIFAAISGKDWNLFSEKFEIGFFYQENLEIFIGFLP